MTVYEIYQRQSQNEQIAHLQRLGAQLQGPHPPPPFHAPPPSSKQIADARMIEASQLIYQYSRKSLSNINIIIIIFFILSNSQF